MESASAILGRVPWPGVCAAVVVSLLCVPARAGGRDVSAPASKDFAASWSKTPFDHSLWTAVLGQRVNSDGLVDYESVRSDARFAEYLYRLANTHPSELASDDERKAFWINAYNALAIKGVLETLPKSGDPKSYSVLDVTVPGVSEKGKGFFVGLRFLVGGERVTLDQIEKGMLLGDGALRAGFDAHGGTVTSGAPDPRIHFAIVCAAKGCVTLSDEAYEGTRIDLQLDKAVARFMSSRRQALFDLRNRVMRVSKIIEWYAADFTNPKFSPHAETVEKFLAPYAYDERLERSLINDDWRINYMKYDWSLNSP